MTTTQAGRAALDRQPVIHGDDPSLTENATQKFARKRAEAQAAAQALNAPQDETIGKAPLESIPEPPRAPAPVKPKSAIVLSFTTIYRGRQITITGEHMELDTFCDLLDKKFGATE